MSDNPSGKQPWHDRGLASGVFSGLIVLAAGWLVPVVVNAASKVKLDPGVAIWTAIISAVVTFLILSAAVPGLRNGIWRRLFRLRITTADRVIPRPEPDTGPTTTIPVPDATQRLGQELARLRSEVSFLTGARDDAVVERDAARTELDAVRAEFARPKPPPPHPRWGLTHMEQNGRTMVFRLSNTIPGSVAVNVRVDPHQNNRWRFGEDQHAFWESMEGPSVQYFSGYALEQGARKGWTFNIAWLDEDNQYNSESFTVAAFEEDPDAWQQDATPF